MKFRRQYAAKVARCELCEANPVSTALGDYTGKQRYADAIVSRALLQEPSGFSKLIVHKV